MSHTCLAMDLLLLGTNVVESNSQEYCVFLAILLTVNRISGKSGATNEGSWCINVPRIVIHWPISSSLYSSFGIPHFVHLSVTASSPTIGSMADHLFVQNLLIIRAHIYGDQIRIVSVWISKKIHATIFLYNWQMDAFIR